MKILVTGGAGYIGSHTAYLLQKKKHQVVIYDNLINGHVQAVRRVGAKLIIGDTEDEGALVKILKQEKIDLVMHFAAFLEAEESMKRPADFFRNNDCKGVALLEAMRQAEIDKIIFSSTAAVYGIPHKIPITENSPLAPVNFYGESKVIFEKLLHWYHQIFGLKYISLRYFNAAGASREIEIGEDHRPETHLIPNLLKTVLGQKPQFHLFGNDYDTEDGTCVRDYIHVDDLAEAHVLGAKALEKGMEENYYNLGNGKGYSNKEIISVVKELTGKDFPIAEKKRRAGDPPRLITSSEKIKKDLGWEPKRDLREIVDSAWQWHKKHPLGFKD